MSTALFVSVICAQGFPMQQGYSGYPQQQMYGGYPQQQQMYGGGYQQGQQGQMQQDPNQMQGQMQQMVFIYVRFMFLYYEFTYSSMYAWIIIHTGPRVRPILCTASGTTAGIIMLFCYCLF